MKTSDFDAQTCQRYRAGWILGAEQKRNLFNIRAGIVQKTTLGRGYNKNLLESLENGIFYSACVIAIVSRDQITWVGIR
jgi:hypothetical protein